MDDIKLTNKKQDSYLKKQILTGEFVGFMIFVGQEGVGKKDSATGFAGAVLCDNEDGEPCNSCDNCNLLSFGNHPDLIELGGAMNQTVHGGEGTIKIAEIRGLQKKLYLKPYRAKHKVAIVHDAHLMTEESANALLKILEEPPENSVIILVSPDKTLLPETVVSRGQIVNFGTSDDVDRVVNEELQEDILAIFNNSGLPERFSVIHKYAKDREMAANFLDGLETTLRKDLLTSDGTEQGNISMLEKVQDSRKYLQRNLAGKFVLENLIISLPMYK